MAHGIPQGWSRDGARLNVQVHLRNGKLRSLQGNRVITPFVIPAEAGTQSVHEEVAKRRFYVQVLGPGLRRGDVFGPANTFARFPCASLPWKGEGIAP